MKNLLVVSLLLTLLFSSSCRQQEAETSTKGNLRLTVPESILPVMRAEVDEFLRLYGPSGANIRWTVGTSERAAREFVLDSTRVVFLTRRLSESEQRAVRERSGDLIEVPIAQDGIAVVIHASNPLTQISVADIRAMLSGRLMRWESIRGEKRRTGTIVVYLQDSSDIVQYLQDRLFNGTGLTGALMRMESSLQTLQKVARNPLGIGFVGVSWIDSVKANVKVLAVGQSAADADTALHPRAESIGKFFSPHPAYLYRGEYPLKRFLYMYTKATRADLTTGFGTFVAGNEGQRIFLSHQLVPGTRPIRLKETPGVPE
jgi:phosphate transport system substrate-binding protein